MRTLDEVAIALGDLNTAITNSAEVVLNKNIPSEDVFQKQLNKINEAFDIAIMICDGAAKAESFNLWRRLQVLFGYNENVSGYSIKTHHAKTTDFLGFLKTGWARKLTSLQNPNKKDFLEQEGYSRTRIQAFFDFSRLNQKVTEFPQPRTNTSCNKKG